MEGGAPAPEAPERDGRERRGLWIGLAAAAAVLLARVAYLYDPYLVLDDAYVSFRYAVNLVHGLGLVYNPGERVEGYSNFLWTMLLAAGAACGVDLVRLSIVLALLAALATLSILALWAWQLFAADSRQAGGALLAFLPPLLYAAMGSQARFVVSGMETLLFGALILAGAWLLVARRRPLAAGIVFALATMTRPEGGMYWLLAVALTLLPAAGEDATRADRRRAALRLGISFVALYGPYFLWRYGYYGHLLPNTFYAKASDFTLSRLQRGVRLLGEMASDWSIYPVAVLALAALPRLRASRALRLSAVYVAATVAFFLWVGGDFLAFFGPRFFLPVLPMLLLLATTGLGVLAHPLRSPVLRPALAVALLLLTASSVWFSWPARLSRLRYISLEAECWKRLGLWIAANTPPETVMATGGAGIVPFYSGRFTIDMYGLVDEHIGHMTPLKVGFRVVAHEKFDPNYVLDRHPDLLITGLTDKMLANTGGLLRASARVASCYRPFLLAKEEQSPPADGRWVIEVDRFTPELTNAGYTTAVLQRRQGRWAKHCGGEEQEPE